MYQHKQTGTWIILIFGIIAFALILMGFLHPDVYPMIITGFAILATLALFGSLTVMGDEKQLTFYFGVGAIRKKIRYQDLKSILKVRNKWYWGWGVRWFGRGWLYNVSGLDAVELVFKNGKVLRIGTDDPDTLRQFVESRIKV